MMYATNEGEEFIESVFYPNGVDHSNEKRTNRVPRFLWDPMIDDIFDKGKRLHSITSSFLVFYQNTD